MFQSKTRLTIRIVAGAYVLYIAGKLIWGIYKGDITGNELYISLAAIVVFLAAGGFFVISSALAWKQAKAEEEAALRELRQEQAEEQRRLEVDADDDADEAEHDADDGDADVDDADPIAADVDGSIEDAEGDTSEKI